MVHDNSLFKTINKRNVTRRKIRHNRTKIGKRAGWACETMYTASQPTTNVTINVFLPGLKREISIILAISVLQKTLIRSNIKVEIVIVFLPTSRKYC